MSITKKEATSYLKSRKILETPGKYMVKVTRANHFVDNSGIAKTIVNINAMSPYHASEARRLFADGEYQAATNQNYTFNVLDSSSRSVANGEMVYVTLEPYTTKAGDKTLVVSSWSEVPVKEATRSFDFESVNTEALANSESEFDKAK